MIVAIRSRSRASTKGSIVSSIAHIWNLCVGCEIAKDENRKMVYQTRLPLTPKAPGQTSGGQQPRSDPSMPRLASRLLEADLETPEGSIRDRAARCPLHCFGKSPKSRPPPELDGLPGGSQNPLREPTNSGLFVGFSPVAFHAHGLLRHYFPLSEPDRSGNPLRRCETGETRRGC